jgi:hypothetical protein
VILLFARKDQIRTRFQIWFIDNLKKLSSDFLRNS